ncbi:MAG TPA: site-specific integrase, partial [Rhodothermales bacterium]|nr:site-specific integrase [Rhodothermales bacterium]
RAKRMYDQWQRGELDPWTAQGRPATVDAACRHYVRERGQELRDKGRGNVWLLKAVYRGAGIKTLQEIDVHTLRRAVYDPAKAEATQYSTYTKLHAVFEWLTGAGYFQCNPIKDVKKPSKPQRHPKYFVKKDLGRFIATAPEVYRLQKYARRFPYPLWYVDALLFYLYTGVRRGEGPRVCWGDVHAEHITIRDTKKKKDRIVPIIPPLRALLTRLELDTRLSDSPHEPILKNCTGAKPISGKYLSRKFNQVRELARVPAIGLHGLRHTYAMLLVEKGIPPQAIQKILGHDDMSTTQVYTNMLPADVLSAVQRAFSEGL